MYKRPQIDGHDAHDAGGLRFEVVDALRGAPRHLRRQGVRARATRARWPTRESAFNDNPHAPCTIDLHLKAVGRPWGGEPEWEEGEQKPDLDPEKMFARGHTEQHMAITGTVTVGDETLRRSPTRLGLRDHSWGPRFWQNIWWYRWLTVNLGPKPRLRADDRRRRGRIPTRAASTASSTTCDRYGDDRWVPIRDVQAHLRLRRRVVPD